MTCTDDTTSIGRLMAGLPVAGSVTFALFTSAPALGVAGALQVDVSVRAREPLQERAEAGFPTVRSHSGRRVVSSR